MSILKIMNKIKLSLDIGYCFDVLAINEVKYLKAKSLESQDKLLGNISDVAGEIIEQVGLDLFNKVIESEEYQRLFDSNLKTFELVGMAEETEGIGQLVAIANIERFKDKTRLQRKFFNTEPTEVKISKV